MLKFYFSYTLTRVLATFFASASSSSAPFICNISISVTIYLPINGTARTFLWVEKRESGRKRGRSQTCNWNIHDTHSIWIYIETQKMFPLGRKMATTTQANYNGAVKPGKDLIYSVVTYINWPFCWVMPTVEQSV